jgi:hypothetical protein
MPATTAGDSRLALLSQRCQRNPEAARPRAAAHIETPNAAPTGDDVDVARRERYSFPQTPWLEQQRSRDEAVAQSNLTRATSTDIQRTFREEIARPGR